MSKDFDLEIGGTSADFNLEMETGGNSFDIEFQAFGAPSPGEQLTKLSQLENDILHPISVEDLHRWM